MPLHDGRIATFDQILLVTRGPPRRGPHHQIRIVKRSAISVRQRMTEFTALMDRTVRFGCMMAGDAARTVERAEEAPPG